MSSLVTSDQSTNTELIYWNALALFPKFEAKKLAKIVKYFPSIKNVFQAQAFDFIKAGLEERIAQEFINWRTKINPEEEWEKLLKENIKILTIKDENYPTLLKEIYDPPQIIYYKGELKKEEKYPLGVVGTRKMTFYGREVCEELVRDLARAGLTIVSGLALGIDALAHKIALKEKTRTIAVLGGGLDKETFYPKINQDLAKKIVENNGAVISEYPVGFYPTKYTFPARNRIISGLALGTLVIEAPIESGALITAKFALEQNREVFSVPGNIYAKNSLGCNWLIKLGAKPVTQARDIFDEFDLNFEANNHKKITADTKEEEIILKYLSTEPIQINQLIESSGLTSAEVLSTLSLMEINHKVKSLGGGLYKLTP
jgi:DNA processing protein